MRKTGLVWDERFMWFDFGSYADVFGHTPWLQPGTLAETPESKRRILNLLAATGLFERLHRIPAIAVTRDDLARVHTPDYIDQIQELSRRGGSAGRGVSMAPGGYELACLAAGGAGAAIMAVLSGEVDNAYALVRPPGHHAEPDAGMSLCIFANIAVAVRLAQARGALRRVAIVDWDAHHGNGTETVFLHDPQVFTLSIHQDGMVPGRGGVEDTGVGEAQGCNLNIPLPPGSGSGAYLAAMERVVAPALRRFRPELIVVASGLDAAANDPTARQLLVPESYRQLTRQLSAVADEVCGGRLVMVHEGGYEPNMSPFCGLAIFEALSGCEALIPAQDNLMQQTWQFLSQDYQPLQPWQEPFIAAAEARVAGVPEGPRES